MRKRQRENPCGICGHYHKYEGETVPACQNLYKNSFSNHCLPDDKILLFDDANQFLEQCERDRARVLVHCMSRKNKSPVIVIAYLMKSKGWRLAQSYQWVKEKRPSVSLTEAIYEQLQEFEQKMFGSNESSNAMLAIFPRPGGLSFSFGFPKVGYTTPVPAFNSSGATSLFNSPPLDVPHQFTFGSGIAVNAYPLNPNATDIQMDSS